MRLNSLAIRFLFLIFVAVICIHFLLFHFVNKIKSNNYEMSCLSSSIEYKNVITKYRNEFWEEINSYSFLKRSAAFYFIDKNQIRLFMVRHTNRSLNQTLYLKNLTILFKNSSSLNINFSNKIFKIDNYDSNKLFQFVLLSLNLNILNGDDLKVMSLFIRDDLNQTNQSPIDVKIKYFHRTTNKKLDSAICSKCYRYFPNNTDHTRFEWWIEMNRLFGYNHIYICNNSIPNSEAYRRVFSKYEGFIHIYQMNQIPNFIDPAVDRIYMNNMLDLKDDGNYSKPFASVFDMVGMNECYLNNVDKYKYITVIDNDEAIIPRSNKILSKQSDLYNFIISLKMDSCNTKADLDRLLANMSSSCSTNRNENDIMKYRSKFQSNKTISFMMAYYLRDKTVNKILNELDIYFNNTLQTISSNSKEFKVNINDYDFSFKYEFLFQNENDIKYAKNLIKLNRILLKMNVNRKQKNDDEFDRFFYLSGYVTSRSYGKSIHDTQITEYFSHHYPLNVYRRKFSYEYGHLAHFRESYTYAFIQNVQIPISNLQFDLNYFYCYYNQIANHLIFI
jgi:hypothetical protein